jgi:endonuclease YncB( thermonuclease family)
VKVHDGDTLTLRTEDETLKVRLSGLDTPELGQSFENNATRALNEPKKTLSSRYLISAMKIKVIKQLI